MGEYWKPVNLTRKEFIHPHRLNDGLKWGEWTSPHTRTMRAIDALLRVGCWKQDDDIRAVSDSGNQQQLRGSPDPDVDGVTLYQDARVFYKDVSSLAADLVSCEFVPLVPIG